MLPALLVALLVSLPAAHDAAAETSEARAGEVAQLLDRVLTRDQRVELRYLLHLGWRFERDPGVQQVVVDGGHPGRHATLAQAQAAGALRVRVPTSFGESEARAFGPRLAAIADGIPSRLAYQHKLAPALRRAVDRFNAIEATGRYQFPKLFELINSPFWGVRLPESAWTNVDGVYVAYGSSARALESIWTRGGVAECYTGQWLAMFGAQYELYGPRWFEQVFPPNHLQIGKPSAIKPSPIGRATAGAGPYDYRNLVIPPADQRKDAWLTLAPHGPMAYIGIVGVMRNSVQEGAGMNENWILTSITPAAVKQIQDWGGFHGLKRKATEVWTHLNASIGGPLRRFTEPTGEAKAAIDAILAEPAFAETEVYVHPYGIVNLAWLVRDKFAEDDTPPVFTIYRYGRESMLYRRYRRAWKLRCLTHGLCR